MRRSRVLPGFGLSLGITGVALTLVVLLPLSGLFMKTATLSLAQFWDKVTDAEALAAYRLSFGASAGAALVNALFGLLVAWVLVRYRFPGRSIVDALVDLPFALPTAVAGLTLTALYAKTGPLGRLLEPLGIKVAFTPLGVGLALTFVGLPFVVRTVQPVLEQMETDVEDAAASSISRSSSRSTGCTVRTTNGSVTNRSARNTAVRVKATSIPIGESGP